MLNYNFFVSDISDTQTIVLLHGFGGNYRVWKHQIPLLQSNFNVLAIDLPSHGDNNIKLSSMPVTIDTVVQEILKVLDYFHLKKVIFMGVSIGTVFIKHIEMFYQEYVDCAVLVGAVGKLNVALKSVAYLFSKIGDKLPFKWVYSIFSRIMMPLRSSEQSRKIFCKCAEVLNAKEFKNWAKLMFDSIALNIQYKAQEHLQNLYISGCFDVCFLKEIRKEADETNGQFVEMEHCGHICNIDQREAFNKILMNFLNNTKKISEKFGGVSLPS